MPLVYHIGMSPAYFLWHGVPDAPGEIVNPVARLVPGTNKIVAAYSGGKMYDRFRLVVINAETGEQLKIFDLYGGLAALLFK